MLSLIYYEFQKLFNRKKMVVITIIYVLLFGFLLSKSIHENILFPNYQNSLQDLREEIEIKKELYGNLTDNSISSYMRTYQNIVSDKKNYDTNGNLNILNEEDTYAFIKYNDLAELITRVYSPLMTYDANVLATISNLGVNVKDIYKNRIDHISTILHVSYIDKFAQKQSYVYSYSNGWQSLFNDLGVIHIFILITVAFCISPIFSQEYRTNVAPVIYTSKFGKTRTNTAKILSAFFLTTCLYFIPILIYTLFKMYIFGWNGSDSFIQTTAAYWLSTFTFTFFQSYLFILCIGYLACITTMSYCFIFSKAFKKDSIVIIINLLLIILPIILFNNQYLQPVFDFFPSCILDPVKILLNFKIISFTDIQINKIYIIGICLVMIDLLSLFYIKKSMRTITIH